MPSTDTVRPIQPSQVWMPEQVEKDMAQQAPRERYRHGLLKPVFVAYLLKRKGDEKAHEVPYDEWLTAKSVPQAQPGQISWKGTRLRFEIDGAVLNPKLQYPFGRNAIIGMDDWRAIVQPSINDVTGKTGNPALQEFAARANSGTWYVEAKEIGLGTIRNGREDTQFQFTRMTQSLDELHAWYKERWPKGEENGSGAAVPADVVSDAQTIFHRMARGNRDAFLTQITEMEDFAPYVNALAEMSKTW